MEIITHTIAGFDVDAVLCSCGRRFEHDEFGGASAAKEVAAMHVENPYYEVSKPLPDDLMRKAVERLLAAVVPEPVLIKTRIDFDDEPMNPFVDVGPYQLEKADGKWLIIPPFEEQTLTVTEARALLRDLAIAIVTAEKLGE